MSYNDDFFDTFNNFDKLAKSIFDDTSIVNRPFNQNDFLSTYLSLVTNLDPKSIKTLIHMILNSNENGFYTGTYEDLMESLSVSRATLAAIMGELQKQSLIEKTKDGWKVIVNYQLPKDGASIVIKFDNDFNIFFICCFVFIQGFPEIVITLRFGKLSIISIISFISSKLLFLISNNSKFSIESIPFIELN